MIDKVCCFAGHRFAWHCFGVEEKLLTCIEYLIKNGYTIFYDGCYGAFDEMCRDAVLQLKKKYPFIKLIKVLTYYHHNKEKYKLSPCYDDSIFPDIEETHYKAKITMRNRWIVDNSDILVCYIQNKENSGAFNTVKYARKINKPIIYL